MKKKLTPRELKERTVKIKQLSKKGMSERQIAKVVKCSRTTVWYWLNK